MRVDALIVGGGLFGATIARALEAEGRAVLVFDDKRPLNGSAPSGSLMKPSWYSGMGKEVYRPAEDMLARVYGNDFKELEFIAGIKLLKTKVMWVATSIILDYTCLEETVTEVAPGRVVTDQGEYEADLVVVCAGYWCTELVPELVGKMQGKQGVSFRWYEQEAESNLIQPWAPYKQKVRFTEDTGDGLPSIWAGDGTALKVANWTDERRDLCTKRMMDFVDRGSPDEAIIGIRPYVPGSKPCYVKQTQPGLWVATGGAKNGGIAAGWAAHRIVEESK